VQPIHYDYPNIEQWTDSMQSAMDLGPALWLPGHDDPFKTDTVKEIIDYHNERAFKLHWQGTAIKTDSRDLPAAEIRELVESGGIERRERPDNQHDERFKTHIMVCTGS
jgi:hypothetical protein